MDVPKEAVVHDYSQCTLMPGLIDCHCHPFITGENYQFDYYKNSSAVSVVQLLPPTLTDRWVLENAR